MPNKHWKYELLLDERYRGPRSAVFHCCLGLDTHLDQTRGNSKNGLYEQCAREEVTHCSKTALFRFAKWPYIVLFFTKSVLSSERRAWKRSFVCVDTHNMCALNVSLFGAVTKLARFYEPSFMSRQAVCSACMQVLPSCSALVCPKCVPSLLIHVVCGVRAFASHMRRTFETWVSGEK